MLYINLDPEAPSFDSTVTGAEGSDLLKDRGNLETGVFRTEAKQNAGMSGYGAQSFSKTAQQTAA